MDDLIAFLNARLDEDEAAALAAARADGKYGGRPHWSPLGGGMITDSGDPDWGVVDLSPCIEDGDLAGHIARHDPARVLRDIAGARRILELSDDADWLDRTLDDEVARTAKPGETTLGEEIRRALAVAWSDHADCRQEWKP